MNGILYVPLPSILTALPSIVNSIVGDVILLTSFKNNSALIEALNVSLAGRSKLTVTKYSLFVTFILKTVPFATSSIVSVYNDTFFESIAVRIL